MPFSLSLFLCEERVLCAVYTFVSFPSPLTFFHLFLHAMLKHSDNGRPRACSHADLTPTRVCQLEYLVPYDFLDLQSFVKFLSGLLGYPFTRNFHASIINIYENYTRPPSPPPLCTHVTNTETFRGVSSPHVLFPSRESSSRITLHLALLDLISPLAGFTRQRTSVCRAHGGTFHLYTRTLRNTDRERGRGRKRIYTYTYTNTDTALVIRSVAARVCGHALTRRTLGVDAWTTTPQRSCDRQLNEGGVCTFRRLYATREESAAAAAAAAVRRRCGGARYIAWRTLRTGFGPPRRRTDIPDSVNRLNCARFTPRSRCTAPTPTRQSARDSERPVSDNRPVVVPRVRIGHARQSARIRCQRRVATSHVFPRPSTSRRETVGRTPSRAPSPRSGPVDVHGIWGGKKGCVADVAK